MPRLFTRQKRYKQVGATSQKHRFWKGNQEGRKRMKSFPTEEKAQAWAKAEKLDEKTHELRQLKTKWQWKKRRVA
ncbi:hypothetical protein GOV07_02170 [Candidatus Woesearchaeota archaeon]|nr:hypothetical protein [Candidatus Woesearchaeota archaeon]